MLSSLTDSMNLSTSKFPLSVIRSSMSGDISAKLCLYLAHNYPMSSFVFVGKQKYVDEAFENLYISLPREEEVLHVCHGFLSV